MTFFFNPLQTLKQYVIFIAFAIFMVFYFTYNLPINLFTIFIILLFIQIISFLVFNKKSDFNLLHKYIGDLSQCQFILSIILWVLLYDSLNLDLSNTSYNTYDMYFLLPFFTNEVPILISLKIDWLSFFFLFLTNLFTYLCIISLSKTQEFFKETLFFLIFLQWGLILAFTTTDIFGFFIFFESTLIPIFFIVLLLGSRERKVRASYLISVYTLFGSIFMFFTIMYLYNKTGTSFYYILNTIDFSKTDQFWLWLFFFLAFAAKIPTFPLHIWLPEAHVEAPTIGSVLLAALLLKLGTYGLIRFGMVLFPYGTINFNAFVSLLAIISIIYTSMIAIRQIDLKKIIAYSSVGHMNVVLLGIILLNVENLEGAIFQMLSHGIVSGALFFCVGALYKRYKVRSLKYFGGLMQTNPLLCVMFLIFFMGNISFPGTSSFVGEFVLFMGMFNYTSTLVFLASTSMVLGAIYSLWTFNRISFGNLRNLTLRNYSDLTRNEFYIFVVLLYFLFLMGLQPSIIFDNLHFECLNIIEHIKLQLV